METISVAGAEIYYDKNVLAPEEATKLLDVLEKGTVHTSFKSAVPRDEAFDSL